MYNACNCIRLKYEKYSLVLRQVSHQPADTNRLSVGYFVTNESLRAMSHGVSVLVARYPPKTKVTGRQSLRVCRLE